jgi:hypothetical protein
VLGYGVDWVLMPMPVVELEKASMDGVAESARSAMERKEEVGEDADDMFMVGMVKCRVVDVEPCCFGVDAIAMRLCGREVGFMR